MNFRRYTEPEFAITANNRIFEKIGARLMTPGDRKAPGVFVLRRPVPPDPREVSEDLRIFLIALFGAIGTLARYGLQGVVQFRMGSVFPYGTLLINLTGCFLLGLIGQLTLNRMLVSADMRMAIAIGFFGGYTTFSSFGWETAKMLEDGEWLRATAYVGASVIAGLLLSVAGIRLANKF